MNILYIVPYPPSLIRVRPYNLIRELTKRDHHVTVATVWTDEQERNDVKALSIIADHVEHFYLPRWRSYWNCALALPSRFPLQAVYSWQPELIRDFDDAISINGDNSQFDIVHVEHLRGSKFGVRIKELNPALPVVWDSVDCISLLFKLASERSKRLTNRWISLFEMKRSQKYESFLLRVLDHTLVTSQIDQDALLALGRSSDGSSPNVSVIPNGVDLDYFKPDENLVRESEVVVVSGKMSYHANITMVMNLVDNIMPLVWTVRPSVKLWIVGKDPGQEIRALSKHPQIEVTGTVDDIRPYLRRATLAVSPLTYGVGIQNKVLEAMACGTPVISTHQAVSNLDVIPGEDVVVANSPQEFSEKIVQLIEDPSLQGKIGRLGLRYVENHHRWSAVTEKLEEIYQIEITRKSRS